jgi:hypothetical protein
MGCCLSSQDAQILDSEVEDASAEWPSNETDFIKKCGSIGVDEVCPLLRELLSQESKTLSRTLFEGFMKAYTTNSVKVAKEIVDEDSKSSGTSTLFRELVKKQPAIAYELLNDCYTVEGDSIEFRFEYIEDTQDTSRPDRRDNNSGESPEDSSQNAEENMRIVVEQPPQRICTWLDTKPHILELMRSCDSDDSDVLLHPVVRCLLRWKWSHYIVFFYGINLAIFMVYLGFLTAFALNVPNPQMNFCKKCSSNYNTVTVKLHCKKCVQYSTTIIIYCADCFNDIDILYPCLLLQVLMEPSLNVNTPFRDVGFLVLLQLSQLPFLFFVFYLSVAS